MKVIIVCPAPAGSRWGNRVTAVRWGRFLRELGHQVRICQDYSRQPCELLLALHARKSYPSVAAYRRQFPKGPLIVALTGTDLYQDYPRSRHAQASLTLATRIVVLQSQALQELPVKLRRKTRIVWQSAVAPRRRALPRKSVFEVCVIGNLRPVKDSFRTAMALRHLPRTMPIEVTHAGGAIDDYMPRRARELMAADQRYRWIGEVSHARARNIIARSRLLVISSRLEGGANAASEAIVSGVPVVSSRIGGIIGLLGSDYPGFFPVGDTKALGELLKRAVGDEVFYQKLKNQCQRVAPRLSPDQERRAWEQILSEVTGDKCN